MEHKHIVRSVEVILTAIALTVALGITVVVPDSSSANLSTPLPHSNARLE